MANRTIKDAISIKGINPQYLVEKIIRSRIYDSRYWKEECFALTAELLVDKAMELKAVGGCYGGNIKPSPFICLLLKMLQIQPEKDIIIEFIRNEDFKYVRALGAIYMRLTGTSIDIHKYLEPLYIDYRKMKRMNKMAKYELVHMDEFIDELLHSERVCDVALPRIQKRQVLEEANELEARVSPLDVNLDDIETSSSEEEEEDDEDDDDDDEDEDSRSDDSRQKRKSKHSSGGRDRNRDSSRDRSNRDGSSSRRSKREKYVDYDNPNPYDEMPRYKRSPSPKSKSKKSSSSSRKHRRSRSRSKDRSPSSSSKPKSSRHDSRKSRSRSRSRSRDRNKSSKSYKSSGGHYKSSRRSRSMSY